MIQPGRYRMRTVENGQEVVAEVQVLQVSNHLIEVHDRARGLKIMNTAASTFVSLAPLHTPVEYQEPDLAELDLDYSPALDDG